MSTSIQKRTKAALRKKAEEKPVATENEGDQVGKKIAIDAIKLPKKQPRRSFDPIKLQQLIESVRKFGILEPLIVRPLPDEAYELVAGERRYRAANEIGLVDVPVIVRDMTEKEAFELALLENLQRDDLNPIDETEGLLDLLCESLDMSKSRVISLLNKAASAERRGQEIADNVTRSKIEKIDEIFLTVGRINRESFRSNRLPILNLPSDVLAFLRKGELEYTKAKAIAKIEDKRGRQKLMKQVVAEGLSLREVKKCVSAMAEGDSASNKSLEIKKELKSISSIKSAAWSDESKQQRIQSLLVEIREVLRN